MSEIEAKAAVEALFGVEDVYHEPLTPPQIEQEIYALNERIGKGVQVHASLLAARLAAESDYKKAHGLAFIAHHGPVGEKKSAADVATDELRRAWDVSRVKERYAAELLSSLRGELIAFQSLNKSVTAAYATDRGFGR